jgi:hypothetical protein
LTAVATEGKEHGAFANMPTDDKRSFASSFKLKLSQAVGVQLKVDFGQFGKLVSTIMVKDGTVEMSAYLGEETTLADAPQADEVLPKLANTLVATLRKHINFGMLELGGAGDADPIKVTALRFCAVLIVALPRTTDLGSSDTTHVRSD